MTYRANVIAIPPRVQDEMRGVSWHPDPRCPSFDALVIVQLMHWDMGGVEREGEIVVAAPCGEDVARIFERIHAARFPIEQVVRVSAYGGCDETSMAANNTSGFNFRTIAGTDHLSHHALGAAIDINPLQNPYVFRDRVLPPASAPFLDRSRPRPGMVLRPGPVIEAFEAFGWAWGGDWSSSKDYQHFSIDLPGASA